MAEEMNNKLIDYYEAENNPDTNDTAEDSIDELFENIPLYHYLNTVFAKTEAEFEDSLIERIKCVIQRIYESAIHKFNDGRHSCC